MKTKATLTAVWGCVAALSLGACGSSGGGAAPVVPTDQAGLTAGAVQGAVAGAINGILAAGGGSANISQTQSVRVLKTPTIAACLDDPLASTLPCYQIWGGASGITAACGTGCSVSGGLYLTYNTITTISPTSVAAVGTFSTDADKQFSVDLTDYPFTNTLGTSTYTGTVTSAPAAPIICSVAGPFSVTAVATVPVAITDNGSELTATCTGAITATLADGVTTAAVTLSGTSVQAVASGLAFTEQNLTSFTTVAITITNVQAVVGSTTYSCSGTASVSGSTVTIASMECI